MEVFKKANYLGSTPKESDLIGLGWGCPSDSDVQPGLGPLFSSVDTVCYIR